MSQRLQQPNRLAFIALLFIGALRLSQSYPIIFETDANSRQCIDYNIPDGDDAHLLFIPLNDDIESDVEDWYVTQMSELTRHESTQFLKELEPLPSNVQNAGKNIVKSKISASVEIIDAKPPVTKTLHLDYFQLTKMERINDSFFKKKSGWDATRGQFRICISVRGKRDVLVLFDAIKVSEYETKLAKRHILKKDHLNPIEISFDEGISLAHSVIDEMHYMEKREIRMKKTTDGTNRRIRYFSYLSILILLGVTWVQIQYLKSYFKKKKVL